MHKSRGHISKPARNFEKKIQFFLDYAIFFTVNPVIFGVVLTAKKTHVICWNITTYINMDVKLLRPVWKDLLDTVNTVVLTEYWKQLIIFLFDIQCFFQSGSECGPWTKIIGNSCLCYPKNSFRFFMIFYLQCKSMVEYILMCPLEWIQVLRKKSQFLSRVTTKRRECRQIWKWCWTPVFIAYIYSKETGQK